MTASIVLVGVTHRDPLGRQALQSTLGELAPDVLTVEISPYGIEFRQRHAETLRIRFEEAVESLVGATEKSVALKRGPVRAVLEMIEMPYEWVVATEFAEQNGIPVHAIDSSEISRTKLEPLLTENLAPTLEAILELDDYDLEDWADQQYGLARRYLGDSSWFAYHFGGEARQELERRDAAMKERILELVPDQGTLVHIGGWEHVIGGTAIRTLFNCLESHGVRREIIR